MRWSGSIFLLEWPPLCDYSLFASGFPCGSVSKESACNAGDLGLIPGLERSPGEGKGCPLQYSGLENSTDCIDQGVTKSWTWPRDLYLLEESKVTKHHSYLRVEWASCCVIYWRHSFPFSQLGPLPSQSAEPWGQEYTFPQWVQLWGHDK